MRTGVLYVQLSQERRLAIQTRARFDSEVQSVIDAAIDSYKTDTTVQVVSKIPKTSSIPSTHNPNHWLQIDDVICVFVDMKNSTQLSAQKHPRGTTKIYKFFTDTAVRILDLFEPAYIDVRGDGAFALFDYDQVHTAFAAAVSFKTFATVEFATRLDKLGLTVDAHIGIDQGRLLVRKIGMSPVKGRTDRQNEVWAGRAVNMAAKLAAEGDFGQLIVSDRYFKKIKSDLIRKSCGCGGEKADLWTDLDVSADTKFDFDTAHVLNSHWCENCGEQFCEDIVALDD